MEFKNEIKKTIEKIEENPYQFQKVARNRDIRRSIINRFPFKIYYLIKNFIEVFAVFHTSRNPNKIEK
ncbi:MAG: type II toxin-antitoxin system RelE/ParE family toxin [Bacteroidales bacterium]|nr:type II toxin-antitoxin system RelE/ParE family toxin [Bacteroidales bacterium]